MKGRILVLLLLFSVGIQVQAAKQEDSALSSISGKIDTLNNQRQFLIDKLRDIELTQTGLTESIERKPDSNFIFEENAKLKELITNLQNKINSDTKLLTQKLILLEKELNQNKKSLKDQEQLNLKRIEIIEVSLKSVSDTLGIQLGDLSDSLNVTKSNTVEGLTGISTDLKDKTRYWLIGSMFLTILILIVFIALRYKVADQNKILGAEIENTRKNLQDESLKVDAELLRLFESQITVEKENRGEQESINHALPLKLADEIHKMRKRLDAMDENHDVKVLKRRIESLEETINEMDYSIKLLEGTPYDEGMVMEARFIPDESLKADEQIITRVIRPQVNYKDTMIQSAQVEVSQGI